MKKLYSLERNGEEIVSVEMDVPSFVPRTTLNRQWLKGIVTEEIRKPVTKVRPARPARAPRTARSLKVAA